MPRPGPRMPSIGLRLPPGIRAEAQTRADEAGISLSEQIRQDVEAANQAAAEPAAADLD